MTLPFYIVLCAIEIEAVGYFIALAYLIWEEWNRDTFRHRMGLPALPPLYTSEDLFYKPFLWPLAVIRVITEWVGAK